MLGAAANACAAQMAAGSLGGHLPLTPQLMRCMASGVEPCNDSGVSQLCSLRDWAASRGEAGTVGRPSGPHRSCSSQQQPPADDGQCSGRWQSGGQHHVREEAGQVHISCGPLQGSLPAAALLAAVSPAEAAAADGFGPVVAAMQLIDGLHAATGLPWWATLSLTAVGEFLWRHTIHMSRDVKVLRPVNHFCSPDAHITI